MMACTIDFPTNMPDPPAAPEPDGWRFHSYFIGPFSLRNGQWSVKLALPIKASVQFGAHRSGYGHFHFSITLFGWTFYGMRSNGDAIRYKREREEWLEKCKEKP